MPRWRPAWDLDVDVDGRLLPLHARGEREPRIVMPYRIADEVAVHDLLETHGLPVPHAYGLCDNPFALVMDRLSGFVDLSFAADDEEREHLVDDYLELLARIYAIPLDAAGAPASRCRPIPPRSGSRSCGGWKSGYDRSMEACRAIPSRCSSAAGWRRTSHDTGTPRRGSSPTTRSSSCSRTAGSRACSTSSTRTWAIR
jgi:hypothetical protein